MTDEKTKQAKTDAIKRLLSKEVWHCVFCGNHYEEGPPAVTRDGFTIQCCPFCREYKGLEICEPETCDCWEIAAVRSLVRCTNCRFYDPPPNVEKCYESSPTREICNEFRGKGGNK